MLHFSFFFFLHVLAVEAECYVLFTACLESWA